MGQLLAITHAQRSIDPGFFGATTVIHKRFDAVSIDRPAGCWGKGTWHYWPEFVGADGRRPFGWLRVVADDRGPAADKLCIGTVAPTMGVTPAHAFPQVDAPDLAAFDLDPSCFGGLGQRIECPLR